MQRGFHDYIAENRDQLIFQPRMGFGCTQQMRTGLEAVKRLPFATIGTITLDSFTRMGRFSDAQNAINQGHALNGYPLGAYSGTTNRELIADIKSPSFPIQVRHGSPLPYPVFEKLVEMGIDATEGGPVSYCLPYGRVPLEDSINAWRKATQLWALQRQGNYLPHLESFGGCMMGQLSPPELLVALSVLECIFFQHHGVFSVSLSYAQGTNLVQDYAALRAMNRIATRLLEPESWHMVLYTYMGLFPKTEAGARQLIADSARLARLGGCRRLIVKTVKEAHCIPTIDDNINALYLAYETHCGPITPDESFLEWEAQIHARATRIIHTVLELAKEPGEAILKAFRLGYLDVPWCLHPDNRQLARTTLAPDGSVLWANTGQVPLEGLLDTRESESASPTSSKLLTHLSWLQQRYDKTAKPAAISSVMGGL